jgi:hypothetical protein
MLMAVMIPGLTLSIIFLLWVLVNWQAEAKRRCPAKVLEIEQQTPPTIEQVDVGSGPRVSATLEIRLARVVTKTNTSFIRNQPHGFVRLGTQNR